MRCDLSAAALEHSCQKHSCGNCGCRLPYFGTFFQAPNIPLSVPLLADAARDMQPGGTLPDTDLRALAEAAEALGTRQSTPSTPLVVTARRRSSADKSALSSRVLLGTPVVGGVPAAAAALEAPGYRRQHQVSGALSAAMVIAHEVAARAPAASIPPMGLHQSLVEVATLITSLQDQIEKSRAVNRLLAMIILEQERQPQMLEQRQAEQQQTAILTHLRRLASAPSPPTAGAPLPAAAPLLPATVVARAVSRAPPQQAVLAQMGLAAAPPSAVGGGALPALASSRVGSSRAAKGAAGASLARMPPASPPHLQQ